LKLSKTEEKDIADKVDKILDKFYDGVFEAVDDMRYNADMSKKEITEILIRDLKMGITESFKD
tara:strand:- start:37 stop:225 length:189 start_codon:yes stop_codon:yes gene_type:complete